MEGLSYNSGTNILLPDSSANAGQINGKRFTNEEIERILDGCRCNQRSAQKELYSKYYGYAMSISLRYSSNYDNAVEMINDAFLKIFKDVKNFAPRNNNLASSFTAWLKKIVICACIDHIRKYSKKDLRTAVGTEHARLADKTETAEQIMQHKEIIKCIKQLSPVYKTVFNLYVIEGFSHAEIAGKLGIAENTSKSNLHKAKQNLQRLIIENNLITNAMAL